MASGGPLLRLRDVSKQFDSPDGPGPIKILNGISFDLAAGDSMAVIGPSGSGKSTLLQIIGTLDRPTTGQVSLDGQDLSSLSEKDLAAVRNRQIGFVFQSHYLLPQCTVLENVLVPTLAAAQKQSNGGSENVQARASRLLEKVGLGHRLSHRPGQLSGGECQRVAVVRALINQPQLVLADEPTGALDHHSAQQLAELLTALNREEHAALIVVTHALELAQRMSKVFELNDGKLLAHSQQ